MDELDALPRCYSTPAGIALGALDDIPDREARGFVLRVEQKRFQGFVVRQGGDVFAYVDRCPHAGVPLAQEPHAYLAMLADLIQCSWHGALFSIQNGRCVAGPCNGSALKPWPIEVRGGQIVTA